MSQFPPIEARLWGLLLPQSNGCLEWPGGNNGVGYGVIWYEGCSWSTHRLAWTLVKGPIPAGMNVLHHCDNPPCAQTDPTEGYPEGHLFLGTLADNSQDMASKGRAGTNGYENKIECPAGHAYDEINTYISKTGKRSCRLCNLGAVLRYRARRKATAPELITV